MPGAVAAATAIDLRRHLGPGDLGWVVTAHGEIYAREYGWGPAFDAKVALDLGAAARDWDADRCACRIAVAGTDRLGSVFVVPRDESTAQLRFLVVDPAARGRGLGRRLVAEAVEFGRAAGYRSMILFTFSVLTVARELYARAGFIRDREEAMSLYGHDLVEERWTRSFDLSPQR